jgi:hypothetical protein
MRLSNVFELMLLLAVAATYVGTSFGEMNSTANATTAVLTSGAESKDKVGDISQVVVIKDINYEAPSPERENLNGEWVEITNRGSAVQNMMAGSSWMKATTHTPSRSTLSMLGLQLGSTQAREKIQRLTSTGRARAPSGTMGEM